MSKASSHLEIIHETPQIIVVNKAAGLISEKSPYEDLTVENQVLDYLAENKGMSNKPPYLGVIHRLDRVTSGVLMFAKKKRALVQFNELFSQRKIQKTYWAIVESKPVQDSAVLKNFLIKNQKEKRADVSKTETTDSQKATLSYRVLGQNEFGFLLEVKPKTGRFHQIRAQLAHLGCPIVRDEKYGAKTAYKPLGICLHARELTFNHPITGDKTHYQAPVPNENHWIF